MHEICEIVSAIWRIPIETCLVFCRDASQVSTPYVTGVVKHTAVGGGFAKSYSNSSPTYRSPKAVNGLEGSAGQGVEHVIRGGLCTEWITVVCAVDIHIHQILC